MKQETKELMTRRLWRAPELDEGETLRPCGHWGGETATCPLCGPPLPKEGA